MREKLTFITVSARPENIPLVATEIEKQKSGWPSLRWMIIFDFDDETDGLHLSEKVRKFLDDRSEWISYEFLKHPANKSSGGNHGKDTLIKRIDEGWIYQIDDDNELYPGFIEEIKSLIESHPESNLFCFWQLDRYRPNKLEDIKIGVVDSAMYVFNKKACEGVDYPLVYGGDGGFVRSMIDNPLSKSWLEKKYLCTYNKIRNMKNAGELGKLAIEFNSDKHSRHNYCGFYEELFSEYKDKPISLLELGVLRGGSVRMWRKWFAEAEIYGVDNGTDGEFPQIELPLTKIVKADTQNISICDALKWKQFDIIIDDADHHPYSQLKTMWNTWPLLKDNGIYVIEDVQNFSKWGKHWQFASDFNVVDMRQKGGTYDSVMLVFRKRIKECPAR